MTEYGDYDQPGADGVTGRISALLAKCVADVAVDGAAVAIMTDDASTRDLLYATDTAAERIDELQFTIGEGPCLEAFIRGHAQLEADLGDPTSFADWPTFATEVIDELGVHGVFAFPLFTGGARLGVLELYRRRRDTFTAEQLTISQAAADTVADAVTDILATAYDWTASGTHRRPRGPFRFLRSDVNIAAGILAVQLGVSSTDAFARLRARAYADSRSISSLAYDIMHHVVRLDDDEATPA